MTYAISAGDFHKTAGMDIDFDPDQVYITLI